jgi:Holliday junction resolvase
MGCLVIRRAASHIPIDLLAAKDGVRLAVQTKVKSGFTREERSELLRWAEQFGAKPLLVMKRRGR